MFQTGALIELSGDVYYEEYDIHELPPLDKSVDENEIDHIRNTVTAR